MSRRAPDRGARRRRCAPIFLALGDETRLSLVAKLSDGDILSISQLTKGSRMTRQAVTKHLRVLESARIVRSGRVGRETLYELDAAPLREVREFTDIVSGQWDEALSRLKAFVED